MMNLVEGFLILICVLITIIGASFCLVCVGICFKVYSEIMKEHTIRKRYETQSKKEISDIEGFDLTEKKMAEILKFIKDIQIRREEK